MTCQNGDDHRALIYLELHGQSFDPFWVANGNHATMSMSIHSREVPFSVAPSEQLGSQEELLRLHPLGQVGRSSCGQPSGRMLRRVEHLQGDTQSPTHGQQLDHIHIFGAGVRRNIDDQL